MRPARTVRYTFRESLDALLWARPSIHQSSRTHSMSASSAATPSDGKAAATPKTAQKATTAVRQPANSVPSGITMLVTGLLLRKFSLNPFGQATPLFIGDDPTNSAVTVAILSLFLIPLLDFMSGARGKAILGDGIHGAAVEWLNRAELFATDRGQPDRVAILLACLVSAVGEATVFHYAFLTLVPPVRTAHPTAAALPHASSCADRGVRRLRRLRRLVRLSCACSSRLARLSPLSLSLSRRCSCPRSPVARLCSFLAAGRSD